MNNPYLRPMVASEIFAAAFRLYRDNFALLVTVALIPYAVLLGLSMALHSVGGSDPAPSGAQSFVVSLTFLALLVIDVFVMLSVLMVVAKTTLGESPRVLEIFKLAVRANLAMVTAGYFTTSLVVISGFLLLIVPGVVLGGFFAPLIPVLVLERRRIFSGVTRSITLMRGQLLKGIAVFAFFTLIAGVLPMILFILHTQTGPTPFTPVLNVIIRAVTLPLGFSANVLLYFSLRGGEEGGYGAGHLTEDLGGPPIE